jgi:hypothetical protein
MIGSARDSRHRVHQQEPSVELSSMSGANSRNVALASETPGTVALDLSQSLPPLEKFTKLVIRVTQLPPGAALSRGKHNGDGIWSLSPDELEGLRYIAPETGFRAHVLRVSILGLDDEIATTLVDFEQPVAPPALQSSPILATKGDAEPAHVESADAESTNRLDIADDARSLSESMARSLSEGMASTRDEYRAEPDGSLPPPVVDTAELDRAIQAARADAEQAAQQMVAAQIQELNEALAEARTALEARDEEIEAARHETDAVRADHAQEIDALTETLAERDAEIQTMRREAERGAALKDQVRVLTDELEDARSAHAAHEQAIEAARVVTERAVRAELDGDVRELASELEAATAALARQPSEIEAARVEVERAARIEHDDRVQALTDELAATKTSLEACSREVETARADAEQAVRAELDGQIQSLTEELAAANASLAAQDEAIEVARRESEAAVRATVEAEFQDQIQTLRIELTAAHALLDVSDETETRGRAADAEIAHEWSQPVIGLPAEAPDAERARRKAGKARRARRLASLAASVVVGIGVFVAFPEIERMVSSLWEEALPAGTTGETLRVGSNAANLRAGPSMAEAVIGILPSGATAEKLEERGPWIRIRFQSGAGQADVEGWMHDSVLNPPT